MADSPSPAPAGAANDEQTTTTPQAPETKVEPSSANGERPGDKSFSPPSLERQLTINDPSVHTCFICLLNSKETPDSIWVNPCPCTLEAHEDCLLRWAAESEASQGKKKLRCPACNGRIQVIEPSDAFLKFRDRLHRAYSRFSPTALASIVSAASVVGSASYGFWVMSVFAGQHRTVRWLVPDIPSDGSFTLARRTLMASKIFLLNLIAPGLLINRALPSLASMLMIPNTTLYGGYLVMQNRMPEWPPSPQWVIILMPFVSLTYNNLWYEIFGPLNRRLNRVLRGRPAHEEAAQPGDAAEGGNANAVPAPDDDDADVGVFGAVWRLGNAVLGLFGEEELVIEVDARIGGGDDAAPAPAPAPAPNQAAIDAAGLQAAAGQLEAVADELEAAANQLQIAVDEDDPQAGQRELPAARQGDAAPAPDVPQAAGAENQELNDPAAVAGELQPGDENRSTFADLFNASASALLFPVVSAGIGQVLRYALPYSWTTSPWNRRPTGLLQQRWGRSLVGGCLFVVVKDLVNLYTKYRRVQVRTHRKIKNVTRRRDNGTRGATA
ncbi:uncharacterized protein E0L32_006830 [Thyridium curvatum]|uniref:Uncharacterized protein n=1 Tax=Thyridium curvatum TaxID=1093900 RepID=A0A507B6G0_9PEZI|nr:uncharacterized protein E0L32_006830 [Thyridium curvatum]TPX12418.1 hypothetical protein E0L32_006830 [Thyridium curvatum]